MILNVGGMHDSCHDMTQRVGRDMPLATLDFFARVITTAAAVVAVLTDWLSIIPTEGVASCPLVLLCHSWLGSYLGFEHLLKFLATDGHDAVVPSVPSSAFFNPITGIIHRPALCSRTHMRADGSSSRYPAF